jgi:chromate transporter
MLSYTYIVVAPKGAIIAINAGYFWFTGVAVAWLGLFGPGVTLMFAVLPFWQKFRVWQTYRRVS